jgi:hypothetical protein
MPSPRANVDAANSNRKETTMNITEQARQAALADVDAINNKNLERLLGLFADHGELVHPFGVFRGRDKLAQFYGGVVMHADTQLSVARVAAEGRICVAEVIGASPQAPDKPQYALDLFEVDDSGKVVNLSIYYRNFDLK